MANRESRDVDSALDLFIGDTKAEEGSGPKAGAQPSPRADSKSGVKGVRNSAGADADVSRRATGQQHKQAKASRVNARNRNARPKRTGKTRAADDQSMATPGNEKSKRGSEEPRGSGNAGRDSRKARRKRGLMRAGTKRPRESIKALHEAAPEEGTIESSRPKARMGRPPGIKSGESPPKDKTSLSLDHSLMDRYRKQTWKEECQFGELVERALRDYARRTWGWKTKSVGSDRSNS